MFAYYLHLALRSLGRNRVITALMVLAIAFGVGASMTTLTVLRTLSADPVPGKSHRLFNVQLDPRPASRSMPSTEPPEQLTRTDAEALIRAAKAERQVMMSGGNAAIEPTRADLAPFFADARWTTADFFVMFGAPLAAGTPWTAVDDERAARVVVITRELAEKLFGTIEIIGRSLRVDGTEMRIVGVLDTWRVNPHFYDLNTTVYGTGEQLFAPFSTSRELKLSRSGTTDCWENAPEPEALGAPCTWVQLWVELGSMSAVANYQDFLTSYSQDQRRAGRFEREPTIRLRSVVDWLAFKQVVPSDVRLQTWIALGFLIVCLINTIGLLLTKFLRRASEVGVRRALGASKREIFTQLLIEAAVVGLAGGLVGLLFTWIGLGMIRSQPTTYAALARLDLPMLGITIALAVVSSILAGVFPAWRGCQVSPSIQLKSP
jgi:putative ABC transport system permease protein